MSALEKWIRSMGRPRALPVAILLAVGIAACDDSPTDADTPSLAEVTEQTAQLSILDAALEAADLKATLDGAGPFTVFAPRDGSFEALGGDVVSALLEPANAELLESILTYHVVSGVAARSTDLSDGQTVTTVEGGELAIGVSDDGVTVNDLPVVTPDVEASNGVAHVIDGILVPSLDLVDVAVLNGFGTLVSLVREAGLEETLRSTNEGNGWTVFAPTEEAFEALSSVPSGEDLVTVLTYHVVSGTVESGDLEDGQEVTTVEGSIFTVNIDGDVVTLTDGSGNTVSVTATDVPAENGVIHVIDEVLLPS